jgi:signal-transduction protein with cAMP-binding, CBS, and nucleotidyltransferase domain
MENNFKTAKDIMVKKLVFIEGLDTIEEAITKMKAEPVDVLFVKKRNPQDAFGIITARDIVKKVYTLDLNPSEVNVYEVMSKPVISVPSDMNIRYIPRLMLKAKIEIAPVEENGELIGMISFKSLVHQGLF